jgi:hypothetical protein
VELAKTPEALERESTTGPWFGSTVTGDSEHPTRTRINVAKTAKALIETLVILKLVIEKLLCLFRLPGLFSLLFIIASSVP